MHICSRCGIAYSIDCESDCPHPLRDTLSNRRKYGDEEVNRSIQKSKGAS